MSEEVKEDASGIGSSEHDKAMIEKADETIEEAVHKEAEVKKDIPDWIPDKYKNAEDPIEAFLQGHRSLEKKLGGEEDRDDPSNSKGEEETPDDSDTDTETPEAGPLDAFYEEYEAGNGLSDESYKALEELGYVRDVVDTYIKGYEAQVSQYTTEAHKLVGGEEEYNSMAEWAVDNLTPDQMTNYNDQLALGGDAWELALRGLHSKYRDSGDAPIERIDSSDKAPLNKGITPYLSQDDLTLAVKDKRYKTSPEYRQMVKDKLEISDDATMGANIPAAYAQHG